MSTSYDATVNDGGCSGLLQLYSVLGLVPLKVGFDLELVYQAAGNALP